MKTLRYRIGDQVRPGILDQNEKIRDASSIVPDWDDQNITVEKLNEVKQIDISLLPIVDNHETTRLARNRIWKVKKSDQAKELSKLIVEKHASLSARR